METTNNNSGLTLKVTKVNQYIKKGNLVYTFCVSGDKASVAQYEADQAHLEKGCQYHEVTKQPLFWSNDLGDTIVRSRDGKWRVSNDVVRATSQVIKTQTRLGNDLIADKLADRLADEMLNNIKSAFKVRSTPARTESTPENTPNEQAPESLDGV
jgi:vacuolar-type H+-ATPase subunit E/Vma4